ncbi:MAG: phage head spike fiber domain-containing protein [Oceanicaulis sp.]
MSVSARSVKFEFRSGARPDPRLITDRASPGTHPGGWSFLHDAVTGPLVEFPAHAARMAYGSGVLIEAASTNHVRNPRGEGASTGVPPTHWEIDAGSAAAEIVAHGSADGWPYVDVRLSGAPGGTVQIFFESASGVAAIPGDSWTFSVSAKLAGGDLTGVTSVEPIVLSLDSGSVLAEARGGALTLDGQSRRSVMNASVGSGAATHVRPGLEIASSGAIDLTLRLMAPQMELSSFASSPIFPPTGVVSASDRSADRISLALDTRWARGGLTIMADFARMGFHPANGRQNFWSLDDGTFANILNVFSHSSGACRARLQAGGANDSLIGVQWADVDDRAERRRVLVALSDGEIRFRSGAQSDVRTGVDLSVLDAVTHLRLGCDPAGRALNGYLEALSLIPERLTEEQLAALAAG